jgi:diamine N-acetyltransferase
MKVKLEKINQNNWITAIKLPISEDHNEFLAPNLYSIAEAQFYDGIDTYAIYNDTEMIGFSMFGAQKDEDIADHRFWIWRLMIAEGHRFKGYGKAVINEIVQIAKKKGFDELVLSTEPQNSKAIKFYKSLGFRATGVIEDEEEIYILPL